jgi:hypothetical protein
MWAAGNWLPAQPQVGEQAITAVFSNSGATVAGPSAIAPIRILTAQARLAAHGNPVAEPSAEHRIGRSLWCLFRKLTAPYWPALSPTTW